MVGIFSGLATFISSLGLFGLASYVRRASKGGDRYREGDGRECHHIVAHVVEGLRCARHYLVPCCHTDCVVLHEDLAQQISTPHGGFMVGVRDHLPAGGCGHVANGELPIDQNSEDESPKYFED